MIADSRLIIAFVSPTTSNIVISTFSYFVFLSEDMMMIGQSGRDESELVGRHAKVAEVL